MHTMKNYDVFSIEYEQRMRALTNIYAGKEIYKTNLPVKPLQQSIIPPQQTNTIVSQLHEQSSTVIAQQQLQATGPVMVQSHQPINSSILQSHQINPAISQSYHRMNDIPTSQFQSMQHGIAQPHQSMYPVYPVNQSVIQQNFNPAPAQSFAPLHNTSSYQIECSYKNVSPPNTNFYELYFNSNFYQPHFNQQTNPYQYHYQTNNNPQYQHQPINYGNYAFQTQGVPYYTYQQMHQGYVVNSNVHQNVILQDSTSGSISTELYSSPSNELCPNVSIQDEDEDCLQEIIVIANADIKMVNFENQSQPSFEMTSEDFIMSCNEVQNNTSQSAVKKIVCYATELELSRSKSNSTSTSSDILNQFNVANMETDDAENYPNGLRDKTKAELNTVEIGFKKYYIARSSKDISITQYTNGLGYISYPYLMQLLIMIMKSKKLHVEILLIDWRSFYKELKKRSTIFWGIISVSFALWSVEFRQTHS